MKTIICILLVSLTTSCSLLLDGRLSKFDTMEDFDEVVGEENEEDDIYRDGIGDHHETVDETIPDMSDIGTEDVHHEIDTVDDPLKESNDSSDSLDIFLDTTPICGNGDTDEGEECDDGNTDDFDGCSSTCQDESTYALHFDGDSDCVSIPILFDGGDISELSIEMWVRTNDSSGNCRMLFVYNTTLSTYTGQVKYGVSTDPSFILSVEYPLDDNEWHHIAFTFKDGYGKLWIDGMLKNQGGSIGTTMSWHEPAFAAFGCYDNHPICWDFIGDIREIRISEIERYTSDFGPQWFLDNDEHVAEFWKFDEGEGETANNSASSKTGIISGATWIEVP